MTADRLKIQLLGGTDAQRMATVLEKREVWVVTDGSGVPTGEVYVGDGSTSGGVDLIQAVGSGLTVTGTVSLLSATVISGLLTLTGNLQIGKSDPLIILGNTDQEDSDGGRQTTIMIGGERSGGEAVTSALLLVSHHGSADDDQGRVDLYLNAGSDGLSPTLLALRVSPDGAEFAGEVSGPVGRVIECWNGSTQVVNNAGSPATVNLDTTGEVDSGFSLASNEITCSFDGKVEITWHAVPSWTALTRFSALFSVQQDLGSGFTTIPACFSRVYLRQAATGGGCGIAPRVVSVSSGDKFRMRASAEQAGASMTLPVGGAYVRIRRVASS